MTANDDVPHPQDIDGVLPGSLLVISATHRRLFWLSDYGEIGA
jgi:hypothetical protein